MLPPASQVGVILVEEAGEVLEAHVLAALTPSTKQLIMIGDHQQLRPKVESYNLTVSGGKVRPGPCSSVAVKEGGMPQRMRAHIACSGWWWVGGWAHARAVTRSFGVRRMRPLAHTRPCTAPAIRCYSAARPSPFRRHAAECDSDTSSRRLQGFDLNKSLFERLILGGHPHQQLTLQHRMRPSISAIARHMTYPDLRDDPAMLDLARRPHVLGLASDVVFISHTVHEDGWGNKAGAVDAVSGFASISKCNTYEADFVVQTVNYLLLQGYTTDQMVVLTPYLGQLKVLRDKLSEQEVRACTVPTLPPRRGLRVSCV